MGYVDNAVKVFTDRAQTFEAKAEVDVAGEKIP